MINENYDDIAIFIASVYGIVKSFFIQQNNKKRLIKQSLEVMKTLEDVKTLEDMKTLEDVYFDKECVVDTKSVDVDTNCVDTSDNIMNDSWSVGYGIERVKIYHGHVTLGHSNDTSDDDDF
jgi:hypothetical protein